MASIDGNGHSLRCWQPSRRSVLAGSMALLAGASLPAMAKDAKDKLPLRLSHAPIMPYTNSMIAFRKGFLDDAGLQTDRIVLGTGDIIRSALASGEVDIVAMGTDSLVRARAAGFDWKLLYQADIYDSRFADAALVVRADSPIKSAKDLEGKIVAAAPGNVASIVVASYMNSNGADSTKIRAVDIPYSQALAALQSKQIEAAHIIEPFLTVGLNAGQIRVLYNDLDEISKRFMVSGYVARTKWIDENPEKVSRFTEGMNKSTQFVNSNPGDVLPILAEESKISSDTLKLFFPKHYVIDTHVKPTEIQPVLDFLVTQKQIQHPVTLAEVLAHTFPLAS
jgi:ABC-type nitrate/sulfonate/bicarbonate transport system substrate-binding protein